MTKEALKLALEALKSMKETLAGHDEPTTFNEDEAIKALEEALKQEQGEPDYKTLAIQLQQQRTWVEPNEQDLLNLYSQFTDSDDWTYEKAIINMCKELNT